MKRFIWERFKKSNKQENEIIQQFNNNNNNQIELKKITKGK